MRAPRRIGRLPKPLTKPELEHIWAWERVMIAYYITATVALIAALVLVLLYPDNQLLRICAMVLLVGSVAAGGWIQFRERCPRCQTLLGRQARFTLPPLCKSCGVEFPRNPAGDSGKR